MNTREPRAIEVTNVITFEKCTVMALTDSGAAIRAHAESQGDRDIWGYWGKYSGDLRYTRDAIGIGNFIVLTGGNDR